MTPCSISLALRKLIALTSIPTDGARIGSQRIGQFRLRGRDSWMAGILHAKDENCGSEAGPRTA